MPETPNKREVNADNVEILNLEDDVQETDDEAEDLDEEVIPAVDEEALDEEEETEDDVETAPAESSPEGTSVEEPEVANPAPAPSKKEPAPVEGETPREKALRLETQRLRGLLRTKSVHDLVEVVPGSAPADQESIQKLRDLGYSDEDISNMENAIDIIASKKGYVKQEQSIQQAVDGVVETFIESNPEYKPENDPEDVRWNRFQEILKSGIYNLSGKAPKQLRVIFDKVHKDVVSELGEPNVTTEVRRDAAQRHKIKVVSHSGGTKTAPTKPKTAIDPGVRAMFKGFEDDDLS